MQQNLGLRTAAVAEGALAMELGAVGSVAWNERLQEVVSARAMGFVEKLHVRATFDRVAAGAPLLELYVPDWVAAQEDYLAVARMSGPGIDALRDAARARMRQAGMDEALIARVANEGKVHARVTLAAPVGGIVSELMVREGATVMPGMPLLRLQGTGTVWADGQVPESQAAMLQARRARRRHQPGRTWRRICRPPAGAAARGGRRHAHAQGAAGTGQPGRPPGAGHVRATALCAAGRGAHAAGAHRCGDPHRPAQRGAAGRRRRALPAGGGEDRPGGPGPDRDPGRPGRRPAVVLSGQFLIDSEASLRGLEARLNQQAAPAAHATHRTPARIEAIDGDTVTLDHPPIAALKWPQMVMDFKLPPPAQRPKGLAAGQQVDIEFRMQDGDVPQITAIQRAASGAAK